MQIVTIVVLVDYLTWQFEVFFWIFNILALVSAFHTLSKDEAAEYKLLWLIAMGFAGIYGVAFYYMFRNNMSAKGVEYKIKKESEKTLEFHIQDDLLLEDIKLQNTRFYGISRMVGQQDYITYNRTICKYYPFGQDMFEDMLEDLRLAEKYIFMEYFIIHEGYMWNSILQILLEKAKAGVQVKLMTDGFGSSLLFTFEYRHYLQKNGIEVLLFSPQVPLVSMLKNNRDHRKIMVIDCKVAYNGGINIGDEYINKIKRFGIWKDTGVRLFGPAVWGFTLMFLQMWNSFKKDNATLDYEQFRFDYEEHKDDIHGNLRKIDYDKRSAVIPFGVSPFGRERLGENVYIEILNRSVNYCYITTPYLILSEKMIHALRLAAKRGVDVRIIVPGIADKKLVYSVSRGYYRFLLPDGVKIYEYTPGFLHAKMFVSDDEIAVVGTINLDYRSLYLHFECGTVLCNKGAIQDIKDDILTTMKVSEIILKPKPRIPFISSVLHLITPLL